MHISAAPEIAKAKIAFHATILMKHRNGSFFVTEAGRFKFVDDDGTTVFNYSSGEVKKVTLFKDYPRFSYPRLERLYTILSFNDARYILRSANAPAAASTRHWFRSNFPQFIDVLKIYNIHYSDWTHDTGSFIALLLLSAILIWYFFLVLT